MWLLSYRFLSNYITIKYSLLSNKKLFKNNRLCYNNIMLDITLVAIGAIKDQQIKALVKTYQVRLKPYARLQIVELPAVSFSGSSRKIAQNKESQAIIEYLKKREASNQPATPYLLAERGKVYDSLGFSKWLSKSSPIILIIGGALGFSDELYRSYPQISLSALTFPHEMARLVLLEQLYRSSTILAHKDYHY